MLTRQTRIVQVLALFAAMATLPMSAQTAAGITDQILAGIHHPSPSTADYMRYGEYPVDHSTGVPQIEIPLYTLETGDFSLPITLSYHASGIKVNDVSSPVGLGWTVRAGGLVSRTACSIPDNLNSQYRLFFKDRADVNFRLTDMGLNMWNDVFNGHSAYDSETDRYFYSLPGKSGVFRYDVYSMKIYPIPHDSIIIEEHGDAPGDGYKITDSDGTQYIYTQKETTGGYYGASVTAWYLTKIITGELHRVINFTYTTSQYTTRTRPEVCDIGDVVTWTSYSQKAVSYNEENSSILLVNYVHTVPILASITWEDVTVSFNYAKDRLDAQSDRLVSIVVTDNGIELRHVEFDNNQYFGNTDRNYRLRLDSLTVKGSASVSSPQETWSFSYNSLTPPDHFNWTGQQVPLNLRYHEDWWGYYNGTSSEHSIPSGLGTSFTGANRSSSENHMKMCSLQSITYPTGGKTEFILEANRDGQGNIIGGLRLAALINRDVDGSVLERRTYEYTGASHQMDITDDLFSYTDNVFYFFQDPEYTARWTNDVREHTFIVSQPALPLTGWSGSPVFYSTVTEYLGTKNDNLGKTVYTYTQDTESSFPGSDEDLYCAPLSMRYYSRLYNDDEGLVRPLLVKTEHFMNSGDGQYTPTWTEHNAYTEILPLRDSITTGVRLARRGVAVLYGSNPTPSYAPYGSESEYKDIVFTTSKGYRKIRLLTAHTETDHATGISKTTQYEYDNGKLRTLKPVSFIVTNSDSHERITTYKYPFHMTGDVFLRMSAKGYADVVTEQSTTCEGLTRILSPGYTALSTAADTLFLPSHLLQVTNGTVAQLLSITLRDSAGNIREYRELRGGKSFVVLWGYGDRYPIAIIQGLEYAQVATAIGPATISQLRNLTPRYTYPTRLSALCSALRESTALSGIPFSITTYTYIPGVGIKSQTDNGGHTLSYHYDGLGRLARESDDLGEIASYTYSFVPNRITSAVKTSADPSDTTRRRLHRLYDGLGRGYMEIAEKAGGDGSSLLSLTEYDIAGRELRRWKPVPFDRSVAVSPASFKSAATTNHGDSRPYTELLREPSPLGRVIKEYGAGALWYPDHPAEHRRHGNTSHAADSLLSCKYYSVGSSGLSVFGHHLPGRIHVEESIDEDGRRSFEFTDKFGRTILHRQVDSSATGGLSLYDTYYVYDGLDRLRYILQPMYQKDPDSDKFAFQFRYDNHDNLTWSKAPGAGHTIISYNQYMLPAYMQDAPRRQNGQDRWLYILYDNLGRITEQGECTAKSVSSGKESYIVNHYDGYSFVGTGGFSNGLYPRSANHAWGRPTGQEVKVIPAVDTQVLPCPAIYRTLEYDIRGRVISVVQNHPLSSEYGMESLSTIYSHTDKPAMVTTVRTATHMAIPDSSAFVYSYDFMDRLSSVSFHQGLRPTIHLCSYSYDTLGRLAMKSAMSAGVSPQSFSYDIRDRIVNSIHPSFSEYVSYTGQYAGNASAVHWKRGNGSLVGHSFSYDGLNRLTAAVFEDSLDAARNYSEIVGSYDLNGNILMLTRYGRTGAASYGVVDSLMLSYDGNLLSSVSDSASSAAYGYDFEYGAASSVCSYDSAGRLVSDSSRGIVSISYSPIGTPRSVSFDDGSAVHFIYAADGTKLRDTGISPEGSIAFDYCGDIVYQNGVPVWIRHEEGLISLPASAAGDVKFFVRDRLGSVRTVISGAGQVVERNDYYPFGGPILEGNSSASGYQPQKYSGKEWQDRLGTLDFGARSYNPAVARWAAPDPLAVQTPNMSPYVFCGANPINFVDPNGLDTLSVTRDSQGKWELSAPILAEGNDIIKVSYTSDGERIMNEITYAAGDYGKRVNMLNLEIQEDLSGYAFGVYHISGTDTPGTYGFFVAPGGEPSIIRGSERRVPDGVYPFTTPFNENVKWKVAGVGGNVENRGIKIHHGRDARKSTTGCFIISSGYSMVDERIYFNREQSVNSVINFNIELGAIHAVLNNATNRVEASFSDSIKHLFILQSL